MSDDSIQSLSFPLILIADPAIELDHRLVALLRENQFRVVLSQTADQALSLAVQEEPHLILLELNQPDRQGIEILRELSHNIATRQIPVMITTKMARMEDRLRIMQMGIDDFIEKPYYAEEVVSRVESILQEIDFIDEARRKSRHGFSGQLSEMNVLDLLQTLELGKKSGTIVVNRGNLEGMIQVDRGTVVDAKVSYFVGEDALWNLISWLDGHFQVVLSPVDQDKRIDSSSAEIQHRGKKRIQLAREYQGQLPPLNTVLKADWSRVEDVKLSQTELDFLSLFIRPRSLLSGIEKSRLDELDALATAHRLIEDELLIQKTHTERPSSDPTREYKEQLERARKRLPDPYSRIASFFKRSFGGQDQSPAGDSRPSTASVPIRAPHQVHLTRGELMLIRQRLLAI